MSAKALRQDAIAIWRAGVDAVDSARLVRDCVRQLPDRLIVAGHELPLAGLGRLVVVGTGKAGAGMADGFEQALDPALVRDKVSGWINVPADCVRPLQRIHLHAARPPGLNEPVTEGVYGSQRILELIGSLEPTDVCIVLLSGGGSALLPAPLPGISLDDKQRVTRLLARSGATIHELNTVRKRLSRTKGGGLARATRAGRVIALIISDVVGDPLDVIASGPTTPDTATDADALAILHKYATDRADVPTSIWRQLEQSQGQAAEPPPFRDGVHNIIIGNNAVAADAAVKEARRRGYGTRLLGTQQQGLARDVGRELAQRALDVRDRHMPLGPPACLISGGEPVVQLVPTDRPRRGGRNQELALAALDALWATGLERIAILSGGTDGEDGPTDAAGAVIDHELWQAAQAADRHPADFLALNDSYTYFDATGGLLKTGPTHTNVMDLRVVLVAASG